MAPAFRTSSRRMRALSSRQKLLNLSRLPKLPEGAARLVPRSNPGYLDSNIISNGGLKAVDKDFAQAVRLEAIAENGLKKLGKKGFQTVTRFPSIRMSSLDIRMVPKKLLVVKEKDHSQLLPKKPKNQQSDFSPLVVTPIISVHRFAVVRSTIRRRIIAAFDLIIRRGASPFPEVEPERPARRSEPKVKDEKPGSEKSRILIYDSALADPKAWILPGWAYVVYPRAEVFRMPLPDLLDELRLGLRQGNLKANEWQTRYVSPETGEFIPHLSKTRPAVGPPPDLKPWNDQGFGLKGRKVIKSKVMQLRGPSLYPTGYTIGSSKRDL